MISMRCKVFAFDDLYLIGMAEATDHADTVKALHAHLREEVHAGKKFDEVWLSLLSDQPSLSAYSHAMSTLATQHWRQGTDNASRVTWCVSVCNQYFRHQGDLHNLLLKDLRRIEHNVPTLVSPLHLPPTAEQVKEIVEEWKGKKLKMLDVGSCYNPFLDYKQFDVTAIDIAPAHKSVVKCDFLSVAINPEVRPAEPSAGLFTDSFDIVIFSLLLSFFPQPIQRFQCCCRAHQILKMHGLLLVITPDSSHQNKHAAMMKSWKACIESIGFHRWKYCKDTHLHCMAFRKVMPTQQDYRVLEGNSDKLYIPQDNPPIKPFPNVISPCSSVTENFLSHLPFFKENDNKM